jgi:hypothetical protein
MRIILASAVIAAALCATPTPAQNVAEPVASKPAASPDQAALRRLQTMTARFAPVAITADVASLPANERQALGKIVAAARYMDAIFLRQVWAGNTALLLDLMRDDSALGRARLRYFLINKGPWSELDRDEPFIAGIGPRPPSANFYPQDATKEQVEAWMNGLPRDQQASAKGFFTTIRRGTDGRMVPVPYSLEYQPELAEAAALLREAAALTTQPTLKSYLEKRADAFLSNDYYASDIAWMELDASIEPTIGPYEVYEDEWLNQKAAFEAFIAVRDAAETDKLTRFAGVLQELEDHLPIDPAMRNPKLGALAPIRVVNVVFTAGDANHAVQTAAYNLPNDERVVNEKGSKRVMLKNVQEAKFAKVLIPISRVSLAPADRGGVSFDAFFTHILMHELMHGLGPHNINIGGRATTVREELKESYSALEEAKADISGLWALQYLVDKGMLPRTMERSMYTTFLASAFRTLRFGLSDAHARGIAIQLNTLLDKGAFKANADGTFAVDHARVKTAVAELTGELITVQGTGNAARARELLTKVAVIRPEVQRAIDRMKAAPVDIEPRFAAAEALAR